MASENRQPLVTSRSSSGCQRSVKADFSRSYSGRVRKHISRRTVRGSRMPAAGLAGMCFGMAAFRQPDKNPILLEIVLPLAPSACILLTHLLMSARLNSVSGIQPRCGSMSRVKYQAVLRNGFLLDTTECIDVLIDPGGDSDTGGRSAARLALDTVNRDSPLGAELVDGRLERLGQRQDVKCVTSLFAEMPEKHPVGGAAILAGTATNRGHDGTFSHRLW